MMEPKPPQLRIAAAAIRVDEAIISLPPPARHHNIIRELHKLGLIKKEQWEQGFALSDGRFANRVQAKAVADRAGQLLPRASKLSELYSEDVW